MSAHDDRGQTVPLMAGVLAVTVTVLLGLVALGNLLHDRAQARTAADAAALAGAHSGRREAEVVAADNDSTLESFVIRGPEVEVVVRHGDARASARARRNR